MKKLTYLFVAFVCMYSISCNKAKKIGEINQSIPFGGVLPFVIPPPFNDSSFVFPAGGLSVSYPIAEPTNSKQFIAQYNTSPNKVNSATLQKIVMQIDTPVNGTFYFLDTVQLYISAKGQPEQLGAYNNNVPHDQNIINLTSTNINLKDYFLQDTMIIRVYGHFIALPKNPTYINISTNFNLNANPLN